MELAAADCHLLGRSGVLQQQARKPYTAPVFGAHRSRKMSVTGPGATTSVNMQNIQSMDIETALMMVQSERTKLLDAQLQTQIQEVQNRNEQVAKLNTVLGALNSYSAKISGTDAGSTPDASKWSEADQDDIEIPMNDAIRDAGITDIGFTATGRRTQLDADGKPVAGAGDEIITAKNVGGVGTTKGQIDAAITKVKGMIDAAGNSQQMDMLRLQSMSNKRNEAFDVMTNFVKKMQESRSSIIGNMR
jgi:hypothetical protein